jgi:hypothetical protein
MPRINPINILGIFFYTTHGLRTRHGKRGTSLFQQRAGLDIAMNWPVDLQSVTPAIVDLYSRGALFKGEIEHLISTN